MKRSLVLAAVCLVLFAAQASVGQGGAGDTGLGIQLGDPSGVTLKLRNPSRASYDFLAAWDIDDFFFLNGHLLWEDQLDADPDLRFFYGPGAFIGVRDRGRRHDDDVVVGISGSAGLALWIERVEIFLQITPRLDLIPATEGDFGGGIGFRYYF